MTKLAVNAKLLRRVLVGFIREEVRKVGVQNGILGLSGGIDSALVAYLAAEALGPEHVHAVIMPYRTSNPESEAHARLVAETLGINHQVVEITSMVDAYFDLFPDADNMRRGNKMARERMTILYDHSAACNALVLGTSNKTELLLGYGTLHGDMASALNAIGDIYKTQVWQLSEEMGVPREVIDRVIAAAAMAPMGIPPWEVGVTVFHGRDKVKELASDTADTYAGLLKILDNGVGRAFFRLFTKKTTWQQFQSFILPLGRILVEGQKAGVDNTLYNAPAALLFHVSPYADGADSFIACTYAMIAAEALGLGTCMIGCVSPPVARRKELLKKYGLPAGNTPKIVLIMGYPATRFRKGIRRPFQSVTYY